MLFCFVLFIYFFDPFSGLVAITQHSSSKCANIQKQPQIIYAPVLQLLTAWALIISGDAHKALGFISHAMTDAQGELGFCQRCQLWEKQWR